MISLYVIKMYDEHSNGKVLFVNAIMRTQVCGNGIGSAQVVCYQLSTLELTETLAQKLS
jgi:hypothetical protein